MPADLLCGSIRPEHPKASADLIIAPTLWGSVIPSRQISTGEVLFTLEKLISSSKGKVLV